MRPKLSTPATIVNGLSVGEGNTTTFRWKLIFASFGFALLGVIIDFWRKEVNKLIGFW